MSIKSVIFLGGILVSCFRVQAMTVHHPVGPGLIGFNTKDGRNFVLEMIEGAMAASEEKYGKYKLEPMVKMNTWDRLLSAQTIKTYPNVVIRGSAIDSRKDKTDKTHWWNRWMIVPIPLNMGLNGYRLSLIHRDSQNKFMTLASLPQLKSSGMKAGQGDWADADIIKHNGIEVIIGRSYEGLFGMLDIGRFDFFPRALTEIYGEIETRQQKYPNLVVEDRIAIYYSLPRVLLVAKGNTKLAERLDFGLRTMFKNGSHRKIWEYYNKKFIDKSHLNTRKIIRLENPFVTDGLPERDSDFWYKP